MDYEKLTVVKLKEELKNRDIPLTNLKVKQNYIDRLVQDDEEKAESPSAAELKQTDHDVKEQEEPAAEEDAVQETSEVSKDPPQPVDEPAPARSGEDEEPIAQGTPVPDAPQETEPSRPSSSPGKEESTQDVQPEEPQPVADSNAMEVDTESAPRATTPTPVLPTEPSSAEGKKRKRRSVTPPVTEEVVSKKLKTADEPAVHLEREDEKSEKDAIMPDAPLDESQTTVQPMATSDDVMDVSTKDQDKSTTSRVTRSPNERRFKDLINPAEPDSASFAAESTDITVSPALHPATAAVYIRDLVRPINPSGLRDHVEDLARPPDHSSESDTPLIKDFWVDALRTHAFFLFSSISAASRARAGLHARVWPPEPTRRPLWADFFPEERFSQWVEQERASGGSRPSQAKRWEVDYEITDDSVEVHLVEAAPAGPHRPSIQAGHAAGAPNIPTGPRGSMSGGRRPSFTQQEPRRRSSPPPPRRPSARAVEEASAPFLELDKLFRFTTTKPKLYWQPVSEDLADDRLDELDRETSRDWDPRRDARENGDSLGRGLDQLKRYTFEDGDVIVDGGPEFGGGRAFARNGGGGGGGGRGRGRGPRRGGDSYRR